MHASPATRVFQLQEILKKLIENHGKDLIIVIEDIDRSGDFGIFFLETLKNFLDSSSLSHKVKAIVPLSPESIDSKFEEYLKCLDYQEDYVVPMETMNRFVDSIWIGDAEEKQQLTDFLDYIKEFTSFRLIKFILRKAELRYQELQRTQDGPIFWQATLVIELSEYFRGKYKNDPNPIENRSYREQIRATRTIEDSPSLYTFQNTNLANKLPKVVKAMLLFCQNPYSGKIENFRDNMHNLLHSTHMEYLVSNEGHSIGYMDEYKWGSVWKKNCFLVPDFYL